MEIAVNTRLLLKNKLEGIGWFTYENLKRITVDHPEHHFYFLFDRDYSDEFIFADNITPVILFPQARHPFLYHWWFQYSVYDFLKKIKPDLFISTDGYMPLSGKIKTLNVFHDLNFEHYPKDLPYIERWYYKRYFPRFARKANRIATVSEYSKRDIVDKYKVSPDKIDVVYNGANSSFHPLDETSQAVIREKVAGGKPYFFFIGSLHPRKNLVNLFRAYDIFRKSSDQKVMLVIAGAKKWWTSDIKAVYDSMEYKEGIIFTGRLMSKEVNDLLASAMALTYVSYFEGFGIPIVEAFRCGTPVITSNVTSMPEIAGNAALTADPFKPDSIADAMVMIAENESLRQQLTTAGFERAKQFTWDESAKRLWASVLRVISD